LKRRKKEMKISNFVKRFFVILSPFFLGLAAWFIVGRLFLLAMPMIKDLPRPTDIEFSYIGFYVALAFAIFIGMIVWVILWPVKRKLDVELEKTEEDEEKILLFE
jgi:hypothetical protein